MQVSGVNNRIYIRMLILVFYLTGMFLGFVLIPPDASASFVSDYLFYDFFKESSRYAKILSGALAEVSALLSSTPALTGGWLEDLIKEKIIASAYLRSISGEVRHGEHFIHNDRARSGYRISEDGLLHYNMFLGSPPVFMEVVINPEYIKRSLEISGRKNSLHFLFDPGSGKHIIISGNESLFPDNKKIIKMENSYVMRGLNLLIKMRVPLTDLEIFSIYRFPLGMRALNLFGLIGLLVFAIIVIVWTARGFMVIKETLGGMAMGSAEEDKDKTTDVISEIDREISDIVEEMEGSEQEEKTPGKEKKPGDRLSDLEKDGIIIKK